VDVPTMLRKGRTMTIDHQQTSEEYIAELNAGLRARDPLRIMKQEIRLQTIAEVRERLVDMRVAGHDTAFDIYPRVDGILEQMAELPPS
jgi:hypothetical protein